MLGHHQLSGAPLSGSKVAASAGSATGSVLSAWSVRNGETGSASVAWSVRNAQTGTVSSAWSVRNESISSASGAWSVLANVSASASGAWSIREGQTSTSNGAWSVRNFSTGSVSGAWSIESSVTGASGSASGAWSVRGYEVGFASGAWSIGLDAEAFHPIGGRGRRWDAYTGLVIAPKPHARVKPKAAAQRPFNEPQKPGPVTVFVTAQTGFSTWLLSAFSADPMIRGLHRTEPPVVPVVLKRSLRINPNPWSVTTDAAGGVRVGMFVDDGGAVREAVVALAD